MREVFRLSNERQFWTPKDQTKRMQSLHAVVKPGLWVASVRSPSISNVLVSHALVETILAIDKARNQSVKCGTATKRSFVGIAKGDQIAVRRI